MGGKHAPIKFLTAKLKGPVLAKTGAELLTSETKGGQPQQKVREEFAALIKERLALRERDRCSFISSVIK